MSGWPGLDAKEYAGSAVSKADGGVVQAPCCCRQRATLSSPACQAHRGLRPRPRGKRVSRQMLPRPWGVLSGLLGGCARGGGCRPRGATSSMRARRAQTRMRSMRSTASPASTGRCCSHSCWWPSLPAPPSSSSPSPLR